MSLVEMSSVGNSSNPLHGGSADPEEGGVALVSPVTDSDVTVTSVVEEDDDSNFVTLERLSADFQKEADGEPVNLEAALLNKATAFSCYICLANTIMGAGILGLPYAFAQTGWLVGTIFMMLCATSSVFSLHELSICAGMTQKPSSFYSVAMIAAPQFVWLIDAAVAIKCFGVATSYLVIIGGVMPEAMQAMGSSWPWQDRHLWISLSLGLVAPIAFQNSLEILKFTSTLSVVFVSFVTLVIISFAFPSSGLDACSSGGSDCVGQKFASNPDGLSLAGALPLFIFAFTCQQNTFPVVNEIQNPSQSRIDAVLVKAIGTAFSMFMVVAIAGFVTYGDAVDADVLQSYPESGLTTAVRLCIALLVCFTYPLQCNPSRRSILNIWKYVDNNREPTAAEFRFRYILITVLFLAFSFMIAFVVTNLATVLAFVGATGSTAVSYILPGGFYYALHKDKPPSEAPTWKKYASLAQCIIGCCLVPTCLTLIFLGASSGG